MGIDYGQVRIENRLDLLLLQPFIVRRKYAAELPWFIRPTALE
jgi:hypothetical protein